MSTTDQLELFKEFLPQKPYCTDYLPYGLKVRNAAQAIRMRYIQYNKPTDLRWLVYDVDRSTAHYDWQDIKVPAPNITVMNPENGHAHLLYGLEIPVHMQQTAKQNPIRYAGAIDVAMTLALDSDRQYAKLICKNPLNDTWVHNVWRNDPYALDEMADWLDLSPYRDARRKLPEIGLGRNCNLFDVTRFWAYREIRKPAPNYLFDEFYYIDDFIDRCIAYARSHNTFRIPLPEREVQSIGKSVGKWTYNHMSPEGFLAWAEQRRRKSIEVRQEKSQDRRMQAQELAGKGLTRQQIAVELGISVSSVAHMGLTYTHGIVNQYR